MTPSLPANPATSTEARLPRRPLPAGTRLKASCSLTDLRRPIWIRAVLGSSAPSQAGAPCCRRQVRSRRTLLPLQRAGARLLIPLEHSVGLPEASPPPVARAPSSCCRRHLLHGATPSPEPATSPTLPPLLPVEPLRSSARCLLCSKADPALGHQGPATASPSLPLHRPSQIWPVIHQLEPFLMRQLRKEDHAYGSLPVLVGGTVQGATLTRFLAGWTTFRRNPGAH